MLLDFSVSRQRAERDVRIRYVNPAQFRQVPDIDVVFVRQLARFQQDHQIRAAGEGLPRAFIAGEYIERFAQTRGRDQLIRGNVSSHFGCF